VGSFAAAEAAAELGIPTVFTLAPDPHAAIHALDRTGGLPRDNSGRRPAGGAGPERARAALAG
jgi:hypothetical protein